MSDQNQFPDQPQQSQDPNQGWGQQPPAGPPPAAPPAGPPTGAPYGAPGWQAAPPVNPGQMPHMAGGPPGRIRGTGISILLVLVTCGIYAIVYYYKTHEELKQYTGQGIGGVLAAVLALFIGIASPFLLSSEVGNARMARGLEQRVSGVTGLWILLPLVGGIVWFVKTNGALNEFWTSQGVQPA